jgi:hypothetical protein
VSLVDEFRDKDLDIFYNSPDILNEERLEYEIDSDWILFNLPELEFYGVISISYL